MTTLPRHTAIFAVNDETALEVVAAAQKAHRAIPRELTLCGVDNVPSLCESSSPTVSSVQLDHERAGYMAARMIGERTSGVADIMGEERIVPAPGGVLRLALGESPQYIMNATQVLRSSILAIALCTATMSLAETQTTKTSGDLSDPSFWPNGVIPSDRALLSPSAPANYTISRNVTFAGIRQDVNDVTIDASAGNPIVTMTAPIRISKQREQVPHSRRRNRHGDRNILHQASTAENHTLADAWQSRGTVPCLGAGNCERRHASRSGWSLHPLRKARPYRF